MRRIGRRSPSARAVVATAVALCLLPGASDAAAQMESALVVILDASGSMKEAVEGGVKAELAPRGLLTTLERLPSETRMSLRLLGEGREGRGRLRRRSLLPIPRRSRVAENRDVLPALEGKYREYLTDEVP